MKKNVVIVLFVLQIILCVLGIVFIAVGAVQNNLTALIIGTIQASIGAVMGCVVLLCLRRRR